MKNDREQEIEEAAKQWADPAYELSFYYEKKGFIAGAKWSDKWWNEKFKNKLKTRLAKLGSAIKRSAK